MTAVLASFDLRKLWTRTVGAGGERFVTSIMLLYRPHEGGGHKALANITFLRETHRAVEIKSDLWETWLADKILNPPQVLIVRLVDGYQGWLKLCDQNMPLLSKLTESGAFDEDLARDFLMDWEDSAFEAQWKQFTKTLPDHIRVSFDMLPKDRAKQLAWDAYVYAKGRAEIEPVTTFTKAILPIHMLELHWLRYMKVHVPYPKRGSLPRL